MLTLWYEQSAGLQSIPVAPMCPPDIPQQQHLLGPVQDSEQRPHQVLHTALMQVLQAWSGCQPQTHTPVYLPVMHMVPYPSAVAEHGRHLIGAEQACCCVLDKCKPCLGITTVRLWGAWAAERGWDGATAAFLWGTEQGVASEAGIPCAHCPIPAPNPYAGLIHAKVTHKALEMGTAGAHPLLGHTMQDPPTTTPITPLEAPDDKLLHSTYCKGDGDG